MKLSMRGVWGIVAGLFLQVCVCYGDNNGRNAAREKVFEDQLRALNPDLIQTFRDANDAIDAQKYAEAVSLYRRVTEAAPTYEPALRRLGSALCASGHRSEGLALIRQAISLHRSAPNLASLAYALSGVRGGGKSSTDELREALRLMKEARSLEPSPDLSDLSVQTQIALQLEDKTEFQSSVSELQGAFPDSLQTHYFAAISAAWDERWLTAEREIKKAQKLGLSDEQTQAFLANGVQSRATFAKVAWTAGIVFGAWVIGLVSLFGLGFMLSKLTLRSAEKADPNVAITPTERRMRNIYRVVLNTAGVYYYLSLPVVLMLVLGLGGSIIYFFLAIGHIPIKLTIIVIIATIATVVAMIRSLFLKVSSEDPGRPLTREEAPQLWTMAEAVAKELGTRPVDEIRITPGTELAVYERGNWREKMRDEATRILLLGTGVLNGFSQAAFRSVLAHEYGHFSHRDTAGGEVALRVRNDMFKFYVAMVQAGQASHFNLAFHFLRAYNFIFRRISHGATRLQEILADRFAAQAYGADSFEKGLKHVVRRSLEFNQIANHEIEKVIKARQPLLQLYEAAPVDVASIESEYKKSLERETNDDDTHPSPSDRFRLISSVRARQGDEPAGDVWDLFADRETIKRDMLTRVEGQIAQYRK